MRRRGNRHFRRKLLAGVPPDKSSQPAAKPAAPGQFAVGRQSVIRNGPEITSRLRFGRTRPPVSRDKTADFANNADTQGPGQRAAHKCNLKTSSAATVCYSYPRYQRNQRFVIRPSPKARLTADKTKPIKLLRAGGRFTGGCGCDIALSFIFHSKNLSHNAAGVQPIDRATIRDTPGAGKRDKTADFADSADTPGNGQRINVIGS